MKGSRNFYVYALLDPRKPGTYEYGDRYVFNHEPFYVGKGKGDRAKTHFYNAFNSQHHGYNQIKRKRIRKIIRQTGDYPIVVLVHRNLLEASAYKRETKIIALVGRLCVSEGPLLNRSMGGFGGLGAPRKPMNPISKMQMVETNRKSWAAKSEEEVAAREKRWRSSIAGRSKRRQEQITASCIKAVNKRWSECTPEQRESHSQAQHCRIKSRYASMTSEERLRFYLKRRAGRLAKEHGISDCYRPEVRRLMSAHIESLAMASREEMESAVLRKIARLSVKYG